MDDEESAAASPAVVPFLGRKWLIPHILLTLGAVALPFLDDAWDWSTATGGGGFFGAMVMLDLLVGSRQGVSEDTGQLLPGEPLPAKTASPLLWLAAALLLVSILTLAYVGGMRAGLWRPI